MKQAIDLRLIRERPKAEELSESGLVIAERVVDLEGMIPPNKK